VFYGIDVGKSEHQAVGLDNQGTRLHDKALPNDETRLRAVFDQLAKHGPILIVVDQPNTIGALPVTVARSCGHQVAHLPGLSMRRIADLYPSQAKTDACDAFIIADTGRTMPHTLRRVDTGHDTLTELGVLVGFDDDLAGEATRISNQIRGLLTGIHPTLERVLGERITHRAVLEILSRCGGPAGIYAAGIRNLTAIATKHAPRMGARLAADIHTALEAQTVVVPGTAAAEIVLAKLADSLKEIPQKRNSIGDDVEWMLDDHPLSRVLTSRPGVGVRTGARILLKVGDGSAFPSTGHLASHAGIAPVTTDPGPRSAGNTPPDQVTSNSNARCFSRPTPHCTPRSVAPTTTENAPKARKPQCGLDLPGQTPLRRPLRHAQEQDSLYQPQSAAAA